MWYILTSFRHKPPSLLFWRVWSRCRVLHYQTQFTRSILFLQGFSQLSQTPIRKHVNVKLIGMQNEFSSLLHLNLAFKTTWALCPSSRLTPSPPKSDVKSVNKFVLWWTQKNICSTFPGVAVMMSREERNFFSGKFILLLPTKMNFLSKDKKKTSFVFV